MLVQRDGRACSIMPGLGGNMEAKVGVVSAAEVNMPVNGGPGPKWLDGTAPSTWATVVFILAVVYLLKVL